MSNSDYSLPDLVWVTTSGALVWLMVPGVAFLYSGLSRKNHALGALWTGMTTLGVSFFQWWLWGYSLSFSAKDNGQYFIGGMEHVVAQDVWTSRSASTPTVPDVVCYFYQGMFACVTSALMIGGGNERVRLGPLVVFLFLWQTIVYCPIAYWTWNPNGWAARLGSLDFAGGGPVHMCSGAAAMAFALVVGRRKSPACDFVPAFRPSSVAYIIVGTVMLWFGWLGFNGGSAGGANIRGVQAMVNTNLAASCGGLTWMVVDYFRHNGKWTAIGICSGAIVGLVGVTPAAGFVPAWSAVVIGIVSGVAANLGIGIKGVLCIDDGLDVFALHGIGGLTGSVMTAFFASDYITKLDGVTVIKGGWVNGHYVQLGYQLASACATLGWSFAVTYLILVTMDLIPFLKLRMDPIDEQMGTDVSQLAQEGPEEWEELTKYLRVWLEKVYQEQQMEVGSQRTVSDV
ncbi:Ammonium transporter MEP2 [Yarrowia sp. C11]|nr:Ammonium transporter MEP2 [Yarrowia sp. C11]KAG5364558.1 Ammonium transporter MEP2 [Yarrowia sp. E02]